MSALVAYRATLKLLEPAAVASTSEVAFRRDVHLEIPGMVLRGALAAAWIGEYGPPDRSRAEEFIALFERDLRPGPLRTADTRLVPLSVSWCKYPDTDTHREASTRDEAFDSSRTARSQCGTDGCTGSVERGKGQLIVGRRDLVQTRTHVAHEEQRDVAKAGHLHARRYLRAGTRLAGRLFGPADSAFLDTFAVGREVRVGGRRTVAGLARLTLTREAPSTMDPIPAGTPFAVTLLSPGVFVDSFGANKLELPVAELAGLLGINTLPVSRHWIRPTVVSGWHSATQLPKPVDQAVAPGSTWQLTATTDITSEGVDQLLREGLGLRRTEGFGRVEIRTTPAVVAPAPPRTTESSIAEPAIDAAASVWPAIAGSTDARSAIERFLRDLALTPRDGWSEVYRRHEERIGAVDVGPIMQLRDQDAARNVRLLLETRSTEASPEWFVQLFAREVRKR